MCGSAPKDNSAEVARIEAQAAREAREQEAARKAQERSDFDNRLSAAFGTGMQGARDFFTSQGLNPDDFAAAISGRANTARSGVPILDTNPGSYFADLGQQVYDAETTGLRGRKSRELDTVAPTGFATRRIDNTVDDALIESILAEQMQSGEGYIRNLLDRGVITTSGFDAARKNLEGQGAGARSRLNETGLGLIEGGRGGAENIVNDARSAISGLKLGQQFDPFETGTNLNNYFTDFFSNLGTKFRAAAPTNLFDTSGLAGIAGAAQGAGNNAFNPNAIAGIFDQEKKDDETGAGGANGTSPF